MLNLHERWHHTDVQRLYCYGLGIFESASLLVYTKRHGNIKTALSDIYLKGIEEHLEVELDDLVITPQFVGDPEKHDVVDTKQWYEDKGRSGQTPVEDRKLCYIPSWIVSRVASADDLGYVNLVDSTGTARWRHQMETFSALLAICAVNSPVTSPHKGQGRGTLMFSLIYPWINGCVNSREAGDLRCHRAHYDVTVMAIMVPHL